MHCGGRGRGEDAGGIYESMGKNTGEDTAADMENNSVAETDGGCVYKLQQGIKRRFSQQQVDEMPHAEGQGRHDNGDGHIGFAHCFE